MPTRIQNRSVIQVTFWTLSLFLLLSTSRVQAQIADRPKAGPEQKKLEVRVGEWKYEGSMSDTPLGPGGQFAGKTTSRMVLDGLFLENQSEDKGVYGGKELVYKSKGMQWYDPGTKTYRTQYFDNDGIVSAGTLTVSGDTWSSTGSMTDSKGTVYLTRDSTTYSADGSTSTTRGELVCGRWKDMGSLLQARGEESDSVTRGK